jgi:pimeloyl-ACP methyl ester carboxylesterase
MEIRKMLTYPRSKHGIPEGAREREYIFFEVEYNHFRDVSRSEANEIIDRYEPKLCECVLCLPDSYNETGEKTPLILSCHGAGSRVCAEEGLVGGIAYATSCLDAGYAVLDVCGSEEHGLTMGCPEHLFALYKAYRYAIRHYNLSERVMVMGASMGGHVTMNFINTFPSIVLAAGLLYPRLHIDGMTVDGHYCIGTWDKTQRKGDAPSTHDRIVEVYRFPGDEWCEENTIGFNPMRARSFVGADGKRAIIPPCPIKIWQGTADETVDPVAVREFAESIRRAGCYVELHMLEGVGHKVVPAMRAELPIWFDRFI